MVTVVVMVLMLFLTRERFEILHKKVQKMKFDMNLKFEILHEFEI